MNPCNFGVVLVTPFMVPPTTCSFPMATIPKILLALSSEISDSSSKFNVVEYSEETMLPSGSVMFELDHQGLVTTESAVPASLESAQSIYDDQFHAIEPEAAFVVEEKCVPIEDMTTVHCWDSEPIGATTTSINTTSTRSSIVLSTITEAVAERICCFDPEIEIVEMKDIELARLADETRCEKESQVDMESSPDRSVDEKIRSEESVTEMDTSSNLQTTTEICILPGCQIKGGTCVEVKGNESIAFDNDSPTRLEELACINETVAQNLTGGNKREGDTRNEEEHTEENKDTVYPSIDLIGNENEEECTESSSQDYESSVITCITENESPSLGLLSIACPDLGMKNEEANVFENDSAKNNSGFEIFAGKEECITGGKDSDVWIGNEEECITEEIGIPKSTIRYLQIIEGFKDHQDLSCSTPPHPSCSEGEIMKSSAFYHSTVTNGTMLSVADSSQSLKVRPFNKCPMICLMRTTPPSANTSVSKHNVQNGLSQRTPKKRRWNKRIDRSNTLTQTKARRRLVRPLGDKQVPNKTMSPKNSIAHTYVPKECYVKLSSNPILRKAAQAMSKRPSSYSSPKLCVKRIRNPRLETSTSSLHPSTSTSLLQPSPSTSLHRPSPVMRCDSTQKYMPDKYCKLLGQPREVGNTDKPATLPVAKDSNSQQLGASASGVEGGGERSNENFGQNSQSSDGNRKSRKRRLRRSNDDPLSSWSCVLCNLGNNIKDLSYLFGPYNVTYKTEEVWVHSKCAVWASGVCLVGNELKGLSEAVEGGESLTCAKCKCIGATITCHLHSCKQPFHYPCAVEEGCRFNSIQFTVTCPRHSLTDL